MATVHTLCKSPSINLKQSTVLKLQFVMSCFFQFFLILCTAANTRNFQSGLDDRLQISSYCPGINCLNNEGVWPALRQRFCSLAKLPDKRNFSADWTVVRHVSFSAPSLIVCNLSSESLIDVCLRLWISMGPHWPPCSPAQRLSCSAVLFCVVFCFVWLCMNIKPFPYHITQLSPTPPHTAPV